MSRALLPPKVLWPDEWAAANRIYPKTAAVPGPRDPHLTPYVVEIERVIAEGRYQRVASVMGSQNGKSDFLLDIMGHRLDQKPAPILYVGPNKQFLTEQFEPRVMGLLDEAACLRDKVARGKRMTKTRKMVSGVPVRLAHAGSSTALKSDPAALALVDEYDEMSANVNKQGDPLSLIERRGDTYADFVCVVVSTPTRGKARIARDDRSGLEFWEVIPSDELESPIWSVWQQGTRHHWCWPCPHCSEYFVPRFSLVRFDKKLSPTKAAAGAHIECPHCGLEIVESHKADMNARGRYVAPGQRVDSDGVVTGDPPDATTASFWTSGLASPFKTISDRVRIYLEAVAIGDDAKIQTAVNGGLGELYGVGAINLRDWEAVAELRGRHKLGSVPREVLRLSCAVDVQRNGFFYSIRGWGGRATSWQVESDELAGYTDEPEVWERLAQLIQDHRDGIPISRVFIDSGFRPDKADAGNHNLVYQFARRFPRLVRATKGASRPLPAPMMRSRIKVTVPGKGGQTEIELVRLDPDYWKRRVFDRLQWPSDQPGRFVLAENATEDYCKQLVSEVRKITPAGKATWLRLNKRNHYLDCEAMNEAVGHHLAMHRFPADLIRDPPATKAVEDEPPAGPTEPAAEQQSQDTTAPRRGASPWIEPIRNGWL